MFFLYFVQLTSIYYVGHLDDSTLIAGVGLGTMLMNVLALAVTQGLNGALESFVSQAYGFGKYKMCGTYLNRGRAIVTVILIPIAILLSISDKLLISI
jgi:Na+-driven multidrug efflux pump